jgi:uncharacterized protein (TIGR00369 family)
MGTEIDSANAILAEVRDVRHPHCRLCGSENEHGLRLKFEMDANGDVMAEFGCEPDYMGYPGIVHGGVVAAMIDSAMSNCLFVRRTNGVTAEFSIRYLHSLRLNRKAIVRARVDRLTSRLWYLSGEVWQENRMAATAKSKYMIIADPAIDSE